MGESESAEDRIEVKASARLMCAAEISWGTGTAWGRVRAESEEGVICARVEKKVDRSGRRGRAVGDLGGSVACSAGQVSIGLRIGMPIEVDKGIVHS